ncbi:hypothetical protein FD723_40355 (plasmid) [Nostoc sp. C052]|uniref:AraC family ligand binding domain-containing protein n=1 Tax=Nostoc sp. C052 TaxID=2576902 RepID=UPI0015C2FFF1|nr:AraC family ligand binding domain-containing protein [Nostoc sp. C052]QLE46467.1 hypothetical protein FD723_40355 [Nostoc sp. C052]
MERITKIQPRPLSILQKWCLRHERLMFPSTYSSAKGRKELHLKYFVKLATAKSQDHIVRPIDLSIDSKEIETLGEILLPEFDQIIVLYYPHGTQIKLHRDSPVYAEGAAQVNVSGKARFSISDCQDESRMQTYQLEEGDCITFNNKQPHAIEPVIGDRWCICFFKIKPAYLQQSSVEQLSLF